MEKHPSCQEVEDKKLLKLSNL